MDKAEKRLLIGLAFLFAILVLALVAFGFCLIQRRKHAAMSRRMVPFHGFEAGSPPMQAKMDIRNSSSRCVFEPGPSDDPPCSSQFSQARIA
jgi:hypothetical protein